MIKMLQYPKNHISQVKYWKSIAEKALIEVYRKVSKESALKLASITSEKEDFPKDISTELDKYIGEIIRNFFEKNKVFVRLCSEEFGDLDIGNIPDVTVFLDELDGTANVFHKIPLFATTIAILNGVQDLRVDKIIAAATLEFPKGTIFFSRERVR